MRPFPNCIRFIALPSALVGIFATATATATAVGPAALNVSDRYIVTLKADADIDSHMTLLHDLHAVAKTRRGEGLTFEGITHHYNISEFQGYAGHFDKFTVTQLKHHDDVISIEPDQLWTVASRLDPPLPAHNTPDQPWSSYSLRRIIHHQSLFAKPTSHPPTTGAGTFAYILASGMLLSHTSFTPHATHGYDATSPLNPSSHDAAGHGTHLAGIIHALAPRTRLISVKVQDDSACQLSYLLDGLQWAASDIAHRSRAARAVIGIAQYGPPSFAFAQAVDAAAAAGVAIILPAGDGGKSAPRSGPKDSVIVSAADGGNTAEGVNWGPDVNVFAPGAGVVSSLSTQRDVRGKGTGTAQAVAWVVGTIVASRAGGALGDAKGVKEWVMKSATGAVVLPDGGREGVWGSQGEDESMTSLQSATHSRYYIKSTS